MKKEALKRGDMIKYKKQIMFKGMETVTAKIVAMLGKYALLDSGDEILIY